MSINPTISTKNLQSEAHSNATNTYNINPIKQLNFSSLSRRYQNLFNSEKHSDCSFRIEERIIKCHKLILSAASPVFEAMLYGPLNDDNKDNSIEISDISSDVFYKMILFIYSGEINFNTETLENCIEYYYCSEKYLLNDLAYQSLIAIKSKLRFENILPALDLAIFTNLDPLLRICIQFFEQCCISSANGAAKFMTMLKSNYYHISRDCLKEIISSVSKSFKKYLIWFVQEWCLQESKVLGLNSDTDLDMKNIKSTFCDQTDGRKDMEIIKSNEYLIGGTFIERTYYKACQPFLVTESSKTFLIAIKSNRFVSLVGLVLHSRLMPNSMPFEIRNKIKNQSCTSLEYKESLKVEIISEQDQQNQHCQVIENQNIGYNCDLNILLDSKVLLPPDEEYLIKITWGDIIGAEYPCSLMCNKAGGISFEDRTSYNNGSILKGLKIINL